MMSSISFYRLLKEDVKKRVWLFWLSISIFLILIPITTVMQIDSIFYWSGDDMNYIKQWFVESQLGNGWIGIFVIAGGILGAISSFTHLHSRKQIDFYHSLPVKRELWFVTAYVSSFIQIMIPCIGSLLIRYGIGSVKGITGKDSLRMLGFVIFVSILSYHLVYTVSAIGMIVTGKLLTGILMTAFLQTWGAFVVSLKEMVMGTAFETYLSMEEATGFGSAPVYVTGQTWESSPLFFYYNMLHVYFQEKSMKGIVGLGILAGILLLVLAVFLYKKRPSEAAGKSVAFPVLEPVIKVLLSVSMGIFFANMAASQYEAAEQFPLWLFIVGIMAAAFVCCVVEFIYSGDMKLLLQKKISFGISIAATTLLCIVLQFDLIGYDTYLPDKGKIAAMSVEFLFDNTDVFENTFSYEKGAEKKRMDVLRTEDFARIYKTAQNGISYVGKEIDAWNDEKYVPVKIAYFLKSGQVVYRKYYVDYMEMYQCMDSLFADREYRRTYFDIDQLVENQYSLGSVDRYLGTYHAFPEEQENLAPLLETYIEELETAPFSVFEKANLVATLHFVKENDYIDYPVYEEFTKTLALLEKEIHDFRQLNAQDISFMTVEYAKPGSEEGEMVRKTIERKDMQEVLDNMCYVQTGFVGRISERNIYVTLGTNMGREYNYYIRKGQVPSCIKNGVR